MVWEPTLPSRPPQPWREKLSGGREVDCRGWDEAARRGVNFGRGYGGEAIIYPARWTHAGIRVVGAEEYHCMLADKKKFRSFFLFLFPH